MNAEALIGTVLGTCTLHRLIGQGGMGAVYLAQQSRPRRQVAVKVLLPAMALTPAQHAAFLERFRRETDAAASLDHPNIMPVHEYGEREGLAYLVMPYVSGGTLGDELEREERLPFPTMMNYLDQMAAALQIAHERGVVHRDIKPANILMTPERRLLLSDFGLVKILSEGETPQTRLTRAGAPIGTPDYMSPEQVIGNEVDARADIYSLGVILYHMITGTTPFRGELAMQVAVQHLQVAPPSLRQFRPELPIAAEQVVLRALAKRPDDRYARAQDLASAFRTALATSGIQLGENSLLAPPITSLRSFTPRGLFDPSWQMSTATKEPPVEHSQPKEEGPKPPVLPVRPQSAPKASMLPPLSQVFDQISEGHVTAQNDIIAQTSMTIPSFTGIGQPAAAAPAFPSFPATSTPIPTAQTRLGMKSRKLRPISDADKTAHEPTEGNKQENGAAEANRANPPSVAGGSPSPFPAPPLGSSKVTIHLVSPPPVARSGNTPLPKSAAAPDQSAQPGQASVTSKLGDSIAGYSMSGITKNLGDSMAGYPGQGTTTTLRLSQSMKIVKVPVAGKPGSYVTGLLPQLPTTPEPEESILPEEIIRRGKQLAKKYQKALLLIATALLIVLGSGTLLFVQAHSHQAPTVSTKGKSLPNVKATASAVAVATADANTVFSDPLDQNTHNWLISTNDKGPKEFVFTDGAYHITATDAGASAISLLTPDEILPESFVYTLSMTEIKGDDGSINNQFGMVMRFSTHIKNGRTITTFYSFEVINVRGGEYQFWKYDDSVSGVSPWTKIWSHTYGAEYHFGRGQRGVNTFHVSMKGSKFSFVVNNIRVGATQDTSLTNGQIGMLVNWHGTEVAFSKLLLTYT